MIINSWIQFENSCLWEQISGLRNSYNSQCCFHAQWLPPCGIEICMCLWLLGKSLRKAIFHRRWTTFRPRATTTQRRCYIVNPSHPALLQCSSTHACLHLGGLMHLLCRPIYDAFKISVIAVRNWEDGWCWLVGVVWEGEPRHQAHLRVFRGQCKLVSSAILECVYSKEGRIVFVSKAGGIVLYKTA